MAAIILIPISVVAGMSYSWATYFSGLTLVDPEPLKMWVVIENASSVYLAMVQWYDTNDRRLAVCRASDAMHAQCSSLRHLLPK